MADFRAFGQLVTYEEKEKPKTSKKRTADMASNDKETPNRPVKTARKQKTPTQKIKGEVLPSTSSVKEEEPYSSVFDEFINYGEPAEPAKTPKKQTADVATHDNELTPSRPAKTPTKAKSVAYKATPSTSEELSEIDKRMIAMRENEGKSWEEIRQWYIKETGETPGKSTLGNRYTRIKASLSTFSEDDSRRLIEAKAEVEAEMEKEKWAKIANRMEQKGASEKHSMQALQKQFKKLSEQPK